VDWSSEICVPMISNGDLEGGVLSKQVVYDFLYYDSARIASFLGQFEPDGVLQTRKRVAGLGKVSQNKVAHSLKGGVPTILEGGGNYENFESERYDKGAEQTYDTMWVNAISFLNYAEGRGMISTEPSEAALGAFVLLKGRLSISDMNLFKAMIENTVLKKSLVASLAGGAPAGPRQVKQQSNSEFEIAFALIPILPNLVQAKIESSKSKFWCALNPDKLSLSTGDLMLKHGADISGQWSMLGVLDAFPNGASSDGDPQGLTEILGRFTNSLRPLLGRPEDAYGVTPLLIFREVSAV
jgi:hypothetical protein